MPSTFKPPTLDCDPRLAGALGRLDGLVDWERRDRGTPGREMRVDLAPIRDLLARLGNPERAFRSVHVAGSKGKGSVAALVAAALRGAGLRVGVYASPHVERVQERVVVDGRPLTDAALAAALERSLDAREAALAGTTSAAAATWFDVITAAAFVAFAEAGVQVAAVECGLGGRLDSTNVLDAPVCVITSIALEHTSILGATLAAIAREKAGIVSPGATVVSGVEGEEARAALTDEVAARGGRLVEVAPVAGSSIPARNEALARAALEALSGQGVVRVADAGALLDEAAVAAARLPGRGERLTVDGIPVVLDGAHVPVSLELLLDELEGATGPGGPGGPQPVVVLGLGADKDAPGLLKVLVGRADRVLCTSPGAGPYRSGEELSSLARRAGLAAETVVEPEAAFERALHAAGPNGWVLVTGSLHLVGAIRGRATAPPARPACSPSSRTCS